MPITGAEIRRIRESLGLSQVAFADLLGTIGNSVARWERDEVRPREPAARLIQMLAANPDLAAELLKTKRGSARAAKKAAKKR